jgi:hypothetical protein
MKSCNRYLINSVNTFFTYMCNENIVLWEMILILGVADSICISPLADVR